MKNLILFVGAITCGMILASCSNSANSESARSIAYTLHLGLSSGGAVHIAKDSVTTAATFSYAESSIVAMTVTAAKGFHFVRWSGDTSATPDSLQLTMTRSRTITAVFALDPSATPGTMKLINGGTFEMGAGTLLDLYTWKYDTTITDTTVIDTIIKKDTTYKTVRDTTIDTTLLKDPVVIDTVVKDTAGNNVTVHDTIKKANYYGDSIHQVTVSAFYISNTECTQGEYLSVMDTNPSVRNWDPTSPVENVSWKDAVRYCNKLSVKNKLPTCYDTSSWKCDITQKGYRLPTEAEWEFACKAGADTVPYFWKNDTGTIATSYAWFLDNSDSTTHPVATDLPNAFGLYDMSGNVWEWTNDVYSKYGSAAQTNPTGPVGGSFHMFRGGCFYTDTTFLRSVRRSYAAGLFSDEGVGFRIAQTK